MTPNQWDVRYERVICDGCQRVWQLIDFRSAGHAVHCSAPSISHAEQDRISALALMHGRQVRWTAVNTWVVYPEEVR